MKVIRIIFSIFLLLVCCKADSTENDDGLESISCEELICELYNVKSQEGLADLLLNITVDSTEAEQNLTEVTELIFINSNLKAIPSTLFTDFSGLRRLTAANIHLEEFNPSIEVDAAQHLNYLDLSGNSLQQLDLMCFVQMPQLRILDLSNNQIEFLNGSTDLTVEAEIVKLQFLNLENNEIKVFAVPGLEIEILNLNNNHLEELVITSEMFNVSAVNNKIVSVKCDKHANIEVLRLSGNRFTNEVFHELNYASKLKVLDLSQTLLEKLSVDSFTGMKLLENLNLAETRLVRIPFGLFASQKSLQVLNLSKNNMDFIDCRWFKQLPSLTTVDISENNVMIFKNCENIKKSSQNFTEISLHGNSWTCEYLEKLLLKLSRLEIDIIGSASEVKVLDNYDVIEAFELADEFFLMFRKYFGLSYKSMFNDSDLKKAFFVALKGNFEGSIGRILYKQHQQHSERLHQSHEVFEKILAILLSHEEKGSSDIAENPQVNVKMDCVAHDEQ